MRTKGAAAETLSPELRTILLFGPWALGKALKDLPAHDHLRAAWARHGEALTASLPRGQRPWFVQRDAFVRDVRGESAQ